jgi:putative addiction module killer protein
VEANAEDGGTSMGRDGLTTQGWCGHAMLAKSGWVFHNNSARNCWVYHQSVDISAPIWYNQDMTECYQLLQTEEFEDWLGQETARSQYQIDMRLAKLRLDGYFGTINNVSKNDKDCTKNQVWELKFNDGRRIYYASFPEQNILLLLGGNKNGQTKDIKKAKSIFVKKTKAEVKGRPYAPKKTKN